MSSAMSDHRVTTPAATSGGTPVSGYEIRRNPGVERLVRDDGSVVVPAAVAGDVLRALVRDLTARVRADGGEVGPGVRRVLYALHDAAQRADAHQPRPGPVGGTQEGPTGTVGVTAQAAAALLGCSTEYARRLARTGRVAATRHGPSWLIDRASLDAYRHGRDAA